MFEAPGAVYGLWVVGLVAAVLSLPVLVALLHRLWKDARNIEAYAAETLAAGLGVAGNTRHVEALKQTIATASDILGTAGAIDQHTAAVEQLLERRAGRSRDSDDG